MDLNTLTDEELAQALHALMRRSEEAGAAVDRLEETVQSVQVHRVELEMQNRALRETQADLEQAIRRYSDLYDHLPLTYVSVTSNGRVVEANAAAVDCLQRPRDKLIGSYMRAFLDAYDGGRFSAHLDNCLQSGRQTTIELTLRMADGSSLPVQLSSRLAPAERDTTPLIHIAITDVSKLKHVQRVLEDINREQEAFSHSISHDLRAPLITISNYARIVLTEHGESLDPPARNMVQRIENASVRMEHTLRNLLEYSTLGREEIALHPVSVDDVVRHVVQENRMRIEQKNAEIDIESPLPRVKASRLALNQVFANLLANALEYTKPGEPPRIRIFAVVQEERVTVKIADQGIGIDRAYHERIFSIFERLHGYSRYPGSGVGLAIVRRALERMNGRVWVESELGKGSCFCLELPKA